MQHFESYSHEQQDEFIYNIFNHKIDGTFLDIAAGHPIIGSNTYSLEKSFGWKGFCFDVFDYEAYCGWSTIRKSPLHLIDVTTDQFTQFLKDNIPTDLVIDYVSLDVNGPRPDMVTEALERVLDAGVKFKSVTFEHEIHVGYDGTLNDSRRILEELGFVKLAADVRLWGIQFSNPTTQSFEDWWIDPQYFDPKLLEATTSNLYYFDVIETIKNNRANSYTVQHHCNRAYPDEYDTFWHDGNRQELVSWFNQLNSQLNLSK